MAKLLPSNPLKWVVFILLVVVLAEATGITGWINKQVESFKNKS